MSSAYVPCLEIPLPAGGMASLPLAGPATRFLAWVVDLLLTLVVLIFISNVGVIGLLLIFSPDAAVAVATLLMLALPILYGLVSEACWRGQTPGKRIFGLRVMSTRGTRLRLWQVIVRNLLRVVDMLPGLYLVGGVTCFVTARGQRLGDLAAGTVVVKLGQT